MPRPVIEVEGINKLVRKLKRAGEDDLLEALKAANKEAALAIEVEARPGVPKRSGKLAGSLRHSATPRVGTVRVGKASIPYAGPIHFGWPARNISPRPFLYEALDRRYEEVVQVYFKRIEELADKVGDA